VAALALERILIGNQSRRPEGFAFYSIILG
jgi:hypothetical protein